MIPAIRLAYRFAFDGEEYGTYLDLPEGSTMNEFVEAAAEFYYSAEDTYEYLKNRAAEVVGLYEKEEETHGEQ